MLQDFFIKREFFLNSKYKSFNGVRVFPSSSFSSNFFKVKFLKPRLSKIFFNSLSFPFLALSNGGLFFYNSVYSVFLIDNKKSQSGLILFDDLYSYKNKTIF